VNSRFPGNETGSLASVFGTVIQQDSERRRFCRNRPDSSGAGPCRSSGPFCPRKTTVPGKPTYSSGAETPCLVSWLTGDVVCLVTLAFAPGPRGTRTRAVLEEYTPSRPESSDHLQTDERRNPGCHMYELRVTRPGCWRVSGTRSQRSMAKRWASIETGTNLVYRLTYLLARPKIHAKCDHSRCIGHKEGHKEWSQSAVRLHGTHSSQRQ
jgi:hypothetical protein